MTYRASIKSYDPDDEETETFTSWDDAAAWLKHQQPFFRGDLASMKVNGEAVRFHGAILANDEPDPPPASPSPIADVFAGLARSNADFKRIFMSEPLQKGSPHE